MALKKAFSTPTEFGQVANFPDAYFRIQLVKANQKEMTVIYDIFAEKGGRLLFTHAFNAAHNTEGVNAVKQGYLAMKALPEFAEAKDV